MNKTKHDTDISILFLSCDTYSDLWKPLFHQFWKYWPDCPYTLYLGSNTISYPDKRITSILSGKDDDWSSSFLETLNKIPSKYIFLWLDDIFPISAIDKDVFEEGISFMKKKNARHIHMQPNPKPDKIMENDLFGEYGKGMPYRVNALGYWEVSYLKTLLLKGENPWNFEIMGSYRSSYADGFYCLMKPVFTRLHVVEKGKIFREAYDYCLTHYIPIDVHHRAILTNTSYVKSILQKIYFDTIMKIHWKKRVSIMNILRKLIISY